MTDQQQALADIHGTPEQFEADVIRAMEDFILLPSEVVAAIRKYRAEWKAAGKQPIS